MIPIDHAMYVSVILFCTGLAGVLTRRNLIVVFVSVELMLNAVNLHVIAAGRLDPSRAAAADSVALFVILLAACEVAVGLGILIALYRATGSLAIDEIAELKE